MLRSFKPGSDAGRRCSRRCVLLLSCAALFASISIVADDVDRRGFCEEDLAPNFFETPAASTNTRTLAQATADARQAADLKAANDRARLARQQARVTPVTVKKKATAVKRTAARPHPPAFVAVTSSDDDEEETMATTQQESLQYTDTFSRQRCIQAQVQNVRRLKKGSSSDAEYLERQTHEVIYTLSLDMKQNEKVMALQRGRVPEIPANVAMGNTLMAAKDFADVSDILLRIIAIVTSLEVDSDRSDARSLIETLHECTVQDVKRAAMFLVSFACYFDVAGIHESEFEHYFVRATNSTKHPDLKSSVQEDLVDAICEDEEDKGRKLTRAEVEALFTNI